MQNRQLTTLPKKKAKARKKHGDFKRQQKKILQRKRYDIAPSNNSQVLLLDKQVKPNRI